MHPEMHEEKEREKAKEKASVKVSGRSGGGAGAEGERIATSEQRRRELADFLRTRREKIKPEQVGITQLARRRTPGLRREEVAEFAGVGTTWYTWLEQARDIQPSAEVLHRLSQALQLNPAEVRHLYALAGKAAPVGIEMSGEILSPSLERLIAEGVQVPVIVLGQRWDVVGMNKLAEEIIPGFFQLPEEKRNWLYYIFRGEGAKEHVSDWETNARRLIAEFRASLAESLDHPWVLELIDLLKAESPEFARWWREHDVRDKAPIIVEINLPDRGKLVFERTVLQPYENSRLKILVFIPISHPSP